MNRYTDDQIARWRSQAGDVRRHLFWVVPLVVWLVGWIPHTPYQISVAGFVGTIVGIMIQRAPGRRLRRIDPWLTYWNSAVQRSDPAIPLTVRFAPRADEVVHFAERGQRCEERLTSATTPHQAGSSGVGGAFIGGLLFGSAGAVVGRAMTSRPARPGNIAHAYSVVPVDTGDIIVTSERFLFMGARNTVDVPLSNIMRFSSIEGTNRMAVEYAGRMPGESYVVDPLVFALCMVRRAHAPGFAMPQPPLPVPLSRAVPADPVVFSP